MEEIQHALIATEPCMPLYYYVILSFDPQFYEEDKRNPNLEATMNEEYNLFILNHKLDLVLFLASPKLDHCEWI